MLSDFGWQANGSPVMKLVILIYIMFIVLQNGTYIIRTASQVSCGHTSCAGCCGCPCGGCCMGMPGMPMMPGMGAGMAPGAPGAPDTAAGSGPSGESGRILSSRDSWSQASMICHSWDVTQEISRDHRAWIELGFAKLYCTLLMCDLLSKHPCLSTIFEYFWHFIKYIMTTSMNAGEADAEGQSSENLQWYKGTTHGKPVALKSYIIRAMCQAAAVQPRKAVAKIAFNHTERLRGQAVRQTSNAQQLRSAKIDISLNHL